jgi:hypothetical protein
MNINLVNKNVVSLSTIAIEIIDKSIEELEACKSEFKKVFDKSGDVAETCENVVKRFEQVALHTQGSLDTARRRMIVILSMIISDLSYVLHHSEEV